MDALSQMDLISAIKNFLNGSYATCKTAYDLFVPNLLVYSASHLLAAVWFCTSGHMLLQLLLVLTNSFVIFQSFVL